ncbi:MAG TPA: hypothetical protein VFP43_12910 [Mesorhizobium sp.]|nr:hypothetical protein [Mesorhizobium sp.]HET9639060.1 hypothetical protein [Allosphingosinicella sp.]
MDELQRQVWDACEKLGEDVVRGKIASGYYMPPKRNLAQLWLDLKERERLDAAAERDEAREAAALSIADRAAVAAETAASEARKANITARIALATAIIVPIVIAYFS